MPMPLASRPRPGAGVHPASLPMSQDPPHHLRRGDEPDDPRRFPATGAPAGRTAQFHTPGNLHRFSCTSLGQTPFLQNGVAFPEPGSIFAAASGGSRPARDPTSQRSPIGFDTDRLPQAPLVIARRLAHYPAATGCPGKWTATVGTQQRLSIRAKLGWLCSRHGAPI